MAGHRPFRDLVADRMKDWSPERRAQYEARKAQFEAEMAATAELTGQAETRAAIEELEAGKGARFPSVEALITEDRTTVVLGKSVSVREDPGGSRINKKKNK